MGKLIDYKDAVQRYFSFSRLEINGLILSILIIGFIISFRDWVIVDGAVDLTKTIINIINGVIVATLILIVHETFHRLWAINTGFRAEGKLWWPGLLAGILIAFATKGWVWFIVSPAIFITHLAEQRLGYFRYGLNMFANGFIALAGVVGTLFLAIIIKIMLFYMPGNFLLEKALYASIWFAIINILPIPPLDGSRLFYMPGGPLIYIFSAGTVIGISVMLIVPILELWGIWLLLLAGLIIGIIGWIYSWGKV